MMSKLFQSRLFGRTVYIGAVIWLAGCASNQPAPVVDLSLPSSNSAPASAAPAAAAANNYRVVRGDTLYAIAFKHGVDYRDLAAWNGIAAPYRIYVDQELRLSAAAVPPTHVEQAPAPATAVAAAPAPTEPMPGEALTSAAPDRAAAATATPLSTTAQNPPVENVAPRPAPRVVAPPQPQAPVASATPPPIAPAPPPQQASAVAPSTATATEPNPPAAIAPTRPEAPANRADHVPELSSAGVTWRWPSDGKVVAAFVSGDATRQGIDVGGQSGDPVRAAADGEVVYSGNGLIGYGELIIVKHNASFLSAYGHNRKRLVKEGDKVKAGQAIAEMGSSASARDELHFEIRKNGKPVNPLEYLPAR